MCRRVNTELYIYILYYGLAGRRLNSHASTKLYTNIVKCTVCFIIFIINSEELSYLIMYRAYMYICCTVEINSTTSTTTNVHLSLAVVFVFTFRDGHSCTKHCSVRASPYCIERVYVFATSRYNPKR